MFLIELPASFLLDHLLTLSVAVGRRLKKDKVVRVECIKCLWQKETERNGLVR